MKKIRAFTMAELAFVFTFVGVISIIAMHTANHRFTDYYSRYTTAYDMLSKVIYQIRTDSLCNIDCSDEEKEKGRQFPQDCDELRKRLTEWLNESIKSNTGANSKSITIKNADDSEFEDNDRHNKNVKTIQLELANGSRLYFSDPKNIIIKDESIDYFIVYVDLNGSAKPNRASKHPNFYADSSGKKNPNIPRPDIVPFIVTSNGDTIPVGFPVYDKTYMSARIKKSGTDVEDVNKSQTKSYTLDEARQLAYGNGPGSVYLDIPITLMPKFENEIPKSIGPGKKDLVNIPKYTKPLMENGFVCQKGTYNCIIDIDYNTGKRF